MPLSNWATENKKKLIAVEISYHLNIIVSVAAFCGTVGLQDY